jgi:hypothetical protein
MLNIKVENLLRWTYNDKEVSGLYKDYQWILFSKSTMENGDVYYDFAIYYKGDYIGDSFLFAVSGGVQYSDEEAAIIVIDNDWE